MIKIDDLEMNEELDRKAMQDLFGGSGDVVRHQSGLRVRIDQSRQRETPKTDFGSVFKSNLDPTGFGTAAGIAAPFIPGGSVVSAAVAPFGQMRESGSG